jgi:hypothetical protein
MIDRLRALLDTISPGPISDTGKLDRALADTWDEFQAGGGMKAHKLLGRMEDVLWEPPLLTFTIERHGATMLGSSRATLQEWAVDLDTETATFAETRYRQLRPMSPRLDVRPLAEEVASLILGRAEDDRIHRYEDGRVRVRVGKILPEGSAVKQTLAARRKRFRAALVERLAAEGWRPCGVNVYARGPRRRT